MEFKDKYLKYKKKYLDLKMKAGNNKLEFIPLTESERNLKNLGIQIRID